MTQTQLEKIYKYHVANLKALQLALNYIARLAKKEIAKEKEDSQKILVSLLRLYTFMLGAWAEVSLKKILYASQKLNDEERTFILKKRTQIEQWQGVVELSFRKNFKIPKAKLEENLKRKDIAAYQKYIEINELINKDLRIIIEIRNKLAHGQWIYPFSSKECEIDQEKYNLVNKENLLSLNFKYKILKTLAEMIHYIIVSPKTLDRDFNRYYRKISGLKNQLDNRKYETYQNSLIEKRARYRANQSN
ncbi:hypothetical protein [Haemophilus sputorum]